MKRLDLSQSRHCRDAAPTRYHQGSHGVGKADTGLQFMNSPLL